MTQKISMAATDGFSHFSAQNPIACPDQPSDVSDYSGPRFERIVPDRIRRRPNDLHGPFRRGGGQVLFHLDDVELVSQLIEGNFPDYNAIIPRSCKTTTILSTAGFLKACKQAEIIAREGNNVIPDEY